MPKSVRNAHPLYDIKHEDEDKLQVERCVFVAPYKDTMLNARAEEFCLIYNSLH